MTRTYLDMMIKSLDEKIELLTRICELNAEQKSILSSEEGVDLEAFRQNVDEKGMLIERINTLNDGFDSLYDHVKKDLEEDKNAFSEEIKKLANSYEMNPTSKIGMLKEKLTETTEILHDNVEKLLQRGEKLNIIAQKSSRLRESSDDFVKNIQEIKKNKERK